MAFRLKLSQWAKIKLGGEGGMVDPPTPPPPTHTHSYPSLFNQYESCYVYINSYELPQQCLPEVLEEPQTSLTSKQIGEKKWGQGLVGG